MFLLREDRERLAHLCECQTAFARIIRGLEAFDDVHIEMQNELVAIAVDALDGDLRGSRGTKALHVRREIAAKRRAIEHFLLGQVEAGDSKQRQVRLANQRRLAPKTHQLGGAAPHDVRHHHSIHAARRRRRWNIQIGVAIHINHADVAEIAAGSGNCRECYRAIAAQNHRQRAGFHGLLDARLQRFERSDHARNIACARALFVYLKKLGRIIAKIGDFVANRAETVN